MANVQRKRSGPSAPVKSKIQAGNIVQVGDLVGQSGGYVKAAEDYSDAQTSSFHDVFLGVLVSGATTGDETDDTECLVETTGDFEFDCVPLPGDKEVGTLVGASDGGSTLANQSVAVTTAAEAIGRLAKPGVSGDTTCLVRIKSVIMADVS